jgi:hypothetical protein
MLNAIRMGRSLNKAASHQAANLMAGNSIATKRISDRRYKVKKSNDQQASSHSPYSAKTYCALLDEAAKGLADIAAGRSTDARISILAIQTRRSASRIQNAPPTESSIL